jgi:hypothetical protein
MAVGYQNLNAKDLQDPHMMKLNMNNRQLVDEVNRLGGQYGPVQIVNDLSVGSGKVSAGSFASTGAVSSASAAITGALSSGSLSTGVVKATGLTATGPVSGTNITASGAVVAASITVGTAQILVGTGTPEGVVSAIVGSLYLNLSGGSGTTLYVKESGSNGNTGWVGK